MSLRTLSGVELLRSVERTSSLPEERFMSTIPVHSPGAHPPQDASELQSGHFERRNSLPSKKKLLCHVLASYTFYLAVTNNRINVKSPPKITINLSDESFSLKITWCCLTRVRICIWVSERQTNKRKWNKCLSVGNVKSVSKILAHLSNGLIILKFQFSPRIDDDRRLIYPQTLG